MFTARYGLIPYIQQITFNLWKVKNYLSCILSLGYELWNYKYSGETRRIVAQFLACKTRKAITIMEECRNLFKKLQILTLTSQYLLSLLMFVVPNNNPFSTNTENHNIDTRQRNVLYLPQANLIIYQKGAYYLRIKIFNNLSLEIKNVAGNQTKSLKLLWNNFYTLIHFTHWRSALINRELCTVSQNSLLHWYNFCGSTYVN